MITTPGSDGRAISSLTGTNASTTGAGGSTAAPVVESDVPALLDEFEDSDVSERLDEFEELEVPEPLDEFEEFDVPFALGLCRVGAGYPASLYQRATARAV
ncbi:hypothetical protein MTE01_32280 [Microbacterium testaceum]|uniref:Uncharacterized protein n=1 Tax=Microbacterium testaceum TaxID=2033 RepID=A0A4Y3QRH1_MICTE|nr:hypothetical protein MTE01_32280 [Microbacterium testaceum]